MLAYILIAYMNELAFAKGTKKAFRIAIATGRRAAPAWKQINIVRLYEFDYRPPMVNEVAGIPNSVLGIFRVFGIAGFIVRAGNEFGLGKDLRFVTRPRLAKHHGGLLGFRLV